MDKLHVCCSTDENYVAACAAMLVSLAETNRESCWVVHVLTSTLSEVSRGDLLKSLCNYTNVTLLFHEVDETKLSGVQFNKSTHVTIAAYYRILLSSIIPCDVHRILYLDCDLIVLDDITDLYQIDLSFYAFAAVKDILRMTDMHRFQLNMPYDIPYFNSGVMMINLDYWRAKNCEDALIEFAKKKRTVFFHDQDALNYVFKGNWYMLSPQWNKLYPSIYPKDCFHSTKDIDAFEHPKIIHFWGFIKPWYKIIWLPDKYKKLYYYYQSKTEWKTSLPKPYINKRNCLMVYRHLLEYGFHRLFACYLTPHYLYLILRDIKHRLLR